LLIFTSGIFERGIVLKGHWRKLSRDWAQRWDLGALLLILAILLTGILSKLDEAFWAVVIVAILCLLLVAWHHRPR
jgi:hypothetical protein